MFNLIIDSAAGLATKPQGADNAAINLFSLATAPPVCVKIVLHLIRMQFSSCISISEVSESALLIPRAGPCHESFPGWWPLWGQTEWLLARRKASVRITLPLHHILQQSYIVAWVKCSSPSRGVLCVNVASRSTASVSSIRVLGPCRRMSLDTAI